MLNLDILEDFLSTRQHTTTKCTFLHGNYIHDIPGIEEVFTLLKRKGLGFSTIRFGQYQSGTIGIVPPTYNDYISILAIAIKERANECITFFAPCNQV